MACDTVASFWVLEEASSVGPAMPVHTQMDGPILEDGRTRKTLQKKIPGGLITRFRWRTALGHTKKGTPLVESLLWRCLAP
jgi:hypothetical protein